MKSWKYQSETSRSALLRAVTVLISGTAVAHGITAATMPLVSRLYTPADFSALAVFSSILAIVSVAACLRFDVAVSLPEIDLDAINLLALGIFFAGFISLTFGILIMLAPKWLAAKVGQPSIEPYLWMLPIGVFMAACSNALQGWYVRARAFDRLARARVAQSAVGAALQVGMAGLTAPPLGLLIAAVMSAGAACATLGWSINRHSNGIRLTSVSIARMVRMFQVYKRFPKYSTWEALSNSAANQIPIIMIAALAAPAEAGYLMLAMYVMLAPMALVGNAIAQVYLSRGPEKYREGRLGEFTAEIFGGLLKAGAGPLIAVGILSPILFGYIFGVEWARAGNLVAWMTPWFVLQFLVSPISMSLHILGRQRVAMLLQILALVTRVLAVWVVSKTAPAMIGEVFALSGVLVYLIYFGFVLAVVKAPTQLLVTNVVRALPLTATWITSATVVAWLLHHFNAVV